MMKKIIFFAAIILAFAVLSCKSEVKQKFDHSNEVEINMSNKTEKVVFGGGCFWCVEAVFQQVDGVEAAINGYAGGRKEDPTYDEVCSGTTGHAEVVQVSYDPEKVSFEELLEIFFKTHDPTTLNRQGADVGTQYRSVIFYNDEKQQAKAEKWIDIINESDIYNNEVVTEVSPLSKFYPADDYHQNYYQNNPNQPYCSVVIGPKINKLEKLFKDKLKN